MKNFYVTTPIYYVNDVPHIGHAYTTVIADVIARFKKIDQFKIMFLTGTDEHGQKIQRSAEKKNEDPQSFVDKLVPQFKDLWKKIDCDYDYFIRTTDPEHKFFVQNIWKKMLEKGYIYLDKYCGWYAVRDEAFYNESDLIDGKAPTGAEVEWIEEPSYFFKLSAFQEKLLDFYEKNPDFVKPSTRFNEVKKFVQDGLNDISISRISIKWGIEVPNDSQHVMYVWLDALFNYISALKITNKEIFWPCDLHIIGKDILNFHTVFWPAFLMSIDLPLPKCVLAHGWWKSDGEKMSKSLGNVVNPNDVIEKFGKDYFRFFMLREMSLGNDGNYSEQALIQRVNGELANNIGNLVQRVVSFTHKNCDGKIPEKGNIDQDGVELLKKAHSGASKMREMMNNFRLHDTINVILEIGHAANVYIDKSAPWKLKNEDKIAMQSVIATLLECIRVIGILMQPFMPSSARKILSIFYYSDDIIPLGKSEGWGILAGGLVANISHVFERLC